MLLDVLKFPMWWCYISKFTSKVKTLYSLIYVSLIMAY